MLSTYPFALLGQNFLDKSIVAIVILALLMLFVIVMSIIAIVYGNIWLQAYMASADVKIPSLIGMGFRQVSPRVIVTAKIMAVQAGLDVNRKTGISTQRLEAHFLAGGNVMGVINAIIAAQRAGIQPGILRADVR